MEEPIKLIKQSYHEARESLFKVRLDLVGLVSGSVICPTSEDKTPLSEEAILEVNTQMENQAKKLGATHIFGIEYRGLRKKGLDGSATFGYGDAYKPYNG